MANFTPGPWSIDRRYIKGPGDNGNIARVVEYVGEFREEGEANARLIAAAPALYEAARVAEQLALIASDWNLDEVEIDGEMRDIYDIRDIFKAALSLALGEK